MECRKDRNLSICNCSYEPCSRKGICCECIQYHRSAGELPACYFNERDEKTYNRSISFFIKTQSK